MNSKSFCEDKFNKFYALLQDGLLREEYRSMTRQKELFQNDAYKVLFCCKDEQIVGVMALWELDDFVFIMNSATSFAVFKDMLLDLNPASKQ